MHGSTFLHVSWLVTVHVLRRAVEGSRADLVAAQYSLDYLCWLSAGCSAVRLVHIHMYSDMLRKGSVRQCSAPVVC